MSDAKARLLVRREPDRDGACRYRVTFRLGDAVAPGGPVDVP